MINSQIQNFIPVCYHPTTVVLVDDNQSLLDSIRLSLVDSIPCREFTLAKDALDFLNLSSEESFLKRCLKVSKKSIHSDEHVEVHLKELFELAYKKERFKEVIVAIVDFAMPNLNGLQFAERLKNKKINVIMLTGEAENSTAIKALNEGLIVKFIKKDAKEIIFTLKRWIFESQMNFFKASSMPILQAFSSKDNNLIQLLSDQSLINYFHELVEKYKIEEYYLMNPTGSFSLIDIQGNIRWFIVKTADQLKKFAESHANLLTKTEVDQLKSGDLMPLLLADQIPEDFDKKYSKYFVKPVCLSGKEIYYVASGTEIMDAPKTDRQICTLDSYIDSLEE